MGERFDQYAPSAVQSSKANSPICWVVNCTRRAQSRSSGFIRFSFPDNWQARLIVSSVLFAHTFQRFPSSSGPILFPSRFQSSFNSVLSFLMYDSYCFPIVQHLGPLAARVCWDPVNGHSNLSFYTPPLQFFLLYPINESRQKRLGVWACFQLLVYVLRTMYIF